ncbi:hypothetical protein AnigIFM59636_002682 [Aspergillus niger]|nr:hypothetical protein AnigIFM59636_002682 [Aspergillus niger]
MERLDEERERERLEEELGLSNQERPVSEVPPRPHEGQVSSLRGPQDEPPEVTHTEEDTILESTRSPPKTDRPAESAPVS